MSVEESRIHRSGGVHGALLPKSLAAGLVAIVLIGVTPAAGHTASRNGEPPDLTIVSDSRMLTPEEVRDHDVSGTAAGVAIERRSREQGSGDIDRRVTTKYRFGEQDLVVSAGTPLDVWVGRNADGKEVYEIAPVAEGASTAPNAGYSVPPNSAWQYSKDGYLDYAVGTWYREIWWTITKANDWKACSTCSAYDYWRIHGKLRAAAVTGAKSHEGFKRAWLEFQRKSDWPSVNSFESDRPEESVAGVANQTTTVGFGTTYGVNIGAPPLTVSGSTNSTYGGSMTKSTENWHPVIRTTIGNGGVQWCRYESAEFTGTKVVSTRTGVRIGATATRGNWNILHGQQDVTTSCPSQM